MYITYIADDGPLCQIPWSWLKKFLDIYYANLVLPLGSDFMYNYSKCVLEGPFSVLYSLYDN